MDYICGICGNEYEPYMRHVDDELWDIPYPNRVRVDMVYAGSLTVHSFETCQQCAGEVLAFINRRKRDCDHNEKQTLNNKGEQSMKMKIYEVIAKVRDIDAIIDRTEDNDTIDMLEEYKRAILDTEVDI